MKDSEEFEAWWLVYGGTKEGSKFLARRAWSLGHNQGLEDASDVCGEAAIIMQSKPDEVGCGHKIQALTSAAVVIRHLRETE